jgi:hypothetical protein
MNKNPYKQMSRDIIEMTQTIEDKVYGSDLEDRLLELENEETGLDKARAEEHG